MTEVFKPGYYVSVELRLKDASTLDVAKKALADLSRSSLAEEQCTLFLIHYDLKTPTRILAWERFESEAAFKQHVEQPHNKAFAALGLTELVQFVASDIAH